MDDKELASLITSLSIPKTHASVGLSNLIASNKQYKSLFVNRRLPDRGWSDLQIQHLLLTLSTLDTNNNDTISSTTGSAATAGRWCGVGEREGRVYSPLVAQRHFGMTHGIGRSGDITEPQPKAVGSSTIARLTLHLVLDVIRRGSGLDGRGAAANGILLPLCTGMSMAMTLTSIRDALPPEEKGQKDVVLWSRIDQKSCYKAIASAGMRCVVVPTKVDAKTDEVVTDMDAMADAVKANAGAVLAIITTASCFAPRVPDSVDEVAKLCEKEGVAHVINNAYGLQCDRTSKLINRACVVGRVDAIVCSTDKNFLVPVGGAIVMSPNEDVTKNIGKIYPGRASGSPILDLFITLLSMGLDGYKRLLADRKRLVSTFEQKIGQVAEKYGERMLVCPRNTISFGITLDHLSGSQSENDSDESVYDAAEVSYFGSILFMRCVSGTRVVPRGQEKKMGKDLFKGFGSSTSNFPHSYLTAACAIGVTEADIDEFCNRLDKAFKDYAAKKIKQQAKKAMEGK